VENKNSEEKQLSIPAEICGGCNCFSSEFKKKKKCCKKYKTGKRCKNCPKKD
jgi:hypothetical protein